MKSRIVSDNVFKYERLPVIVTAYGKDHELPVRTTAFCDRQDDIDRRIADTSKVRTSAEVTALLREGVALFIGAEETERIFPEAETEMLDVDEITLFYGYLKNQSLKNLREYTQKYAPRQLR